MALIFFVIFYPNSPWDSIGEYSKIYVIWDMRGMLGSGYVKIPDI